ncbi:hypothetical protein [Paenibacillus agricola]|nr:hypothetical protein [Paenibacillus agricola]
MNKEKDQMSKKTKYLMFSGSFIFAVSHYLHLANLWISRSKVM